MKTLQHTDWIPFDRPETFLYTFPEFIRRSQDSYMIHEKKKWDSKTYDDTYQDLVLFIECVENDPDDGVLYWAYLKDYNIGYMKGLGEAVFDAAAGFGPEATAEQIVIEDLSGRIINGEFDLDSIFYDFYHIIPEELSLRSVVADEVLSLKEASEALGVSESWTRKLADERTLEAFRYKGDLYITEKSIESCLNFKKTYGVLSSSSSTLSERSSMTDEQFLKSFRSAGGWFILSQYEKIASWQGSHGELVDLLFQEGFDRARTGTSTRVSCVLRIINAGRSREAIEKAMDSSIINSKHPEARELGSCLLNTMGYNRS